MRKDTIKKKIVVNQEEAEVVRLIYQWYLADMGAKAIAERLNREGHRYRGKLWCKHRVLEIVGEEAYAGRYYYNRRDHRTNRFKPKEEWILLPVEPIIDEATWQRARKIKEERTPITGTINPAAIASKTLLTGLAVCGLCGARMSLETAKGGKFTYYNCTNYLRRGKSTCPGQRIPAAELEKFIIDHMANKLFTTDRVKTILKGIYAEMRNMDKAKEGQRKSLFRQIGVIKGKLTRQYEAIESGIIELTDVAERIRELKGQQATIEDKLAGIKVSHTIPLHIFKEESIGKFQTLIREMFVGEDRGMTRSYLKLFIEKIDIKLPVINITCKSRTLLAALENKSAARTGDILAAEGYWLPMCNPFHNRSRSPAVN